MQNFISRFYKNIELLETYGKFLKFLERSNKSQYIQYCVSHNTQSILNHHESEMMTCFASTPKVLKDALLQQRDIPFPK